MPYLASSQSRSGGLTGIVTDASNGRALYNVSVYVKETGKGATTFPDGYYYLHPDSSKPTVVFSLKGYQSKEIEAWKMDHPFQRLDISLFPITTLQADSFSAAPAEYRLKDTLVKVGFNKETRLAMYNSAFFNHAIYDQLRFPDIQPGTDKNSSQLTKRLTGVIVHQAGSNPNLQSFTISGMGERYNQLLLNNMPFPSFDATRRAYPLEVIPVEAVAEISMQLSGDPALPADYAGGAIKITTKDFPVQNFYYLQAGGGFSDGTVGKKFFGDKRSSNQWLSTGGKVRDLPAGFPTTRSEFPLSQKNPQEQIDLAKRLNNNLAPVDQGTSFPNTSVLLGFGRTFTFKNDTKLGLTAYLNHQRSELIDESVLQSSPDPGANTFPFATDTPFIRSSARDRNYRYMSQITALVNGAIAFGNNKISWKNMIGNHFINSFTDRQSVYRNDDDSTARSALLYKTEERLFIGTQVNGEHALGATHRFRLDWNASYLYYRQKNPDDRNFNLRQKPGAVDSFELAVQPGADDLSNNGRLWRQFSDHNFTGQINISLPFTFLSQPQLISGGLFLQNKYRVFSSDFLLVNGAGSFPLNELIAPERYFPGGLSAVNYFVNKDLTSGDPLIRDVNRGNYTASSNTGAAYVSVRNKLNHLSLDWGIRVESNTQLASSSQYQYFTTYKNAQIISLDENIRTISFSYLPSVTVNYEPIKSLNVYGSFFQTVNRAPLQELTGYRYYDPHLFLFTRGNSLLAESKIDNIRGGFNWIPAAGTSVSVSGFYKKIFRPIEYVVSPYLRGDIMRTPHNTPPATVKGIDVSFRTKLDFIAAGFFKYVSVFANGTFLKSSVEAGPLRSLETTNVREHQLSGSPGYTVNGGLTLQAPKLPQLTLLYSRTADYLYAVGSGHSIALANGNIISSVPDYWTKGREQLDIQISQQILKAKLQLIAGVNNVLKQPFVIYQDLDGDQQYGERLVLGSKGNKGGFYGGGSDNAVSYTASAPMYYFRISYLFR